MHLCRYLSNTKRILTACSLAALNARFLKEPANAPPPKYAEDFCLESHDTQSLKEIYETIGRQPWGEVLVAINELLKLTVFVRRSASSNSTRDFSSSSWDIEDENFRRQCQVLVRRRFPHARSTLTDQLSDAVVERRKRLEYRHRHESKIAEVHHQTTRDEAVSQTQDSGPTMNDQPSNQDRKPRNLSRPRHGDPSTLLSIPRPSQVYARQQEDSAVGSVIGAYTSADESLFYPDKPQPIKRGALPECPYCAEPLPPHLSDADWR